MNPLSFVVLFNEFLLSPMKIKILICLQLFFIKVNKTQNMQDFLTQKSV